MTDITGQQLKLALEYLNISLREAGRLIGVKHPTIRLYIMGRAKVRADLIAVLSERLREAIKPKGDIILKPPQPDPLPEALQIFLSEQ